MSEARVFLEEEITKVRGRSGHVVFKKHSGSWVKPRGWNPVSQEEEKEKRLGRSERTFVSHDEEFGFYPK